MEAGEVDRADVLVLGFGRNASLGDVPSALQCMRANHGDTIIEAWNRAPAGVSPVRHMTVENLMAAVDRVGNADAGRRDYVRERWGVDD